MINLDFIKEELQSDIVCTESALRMASRRFDNEFQPMITESEHPYFESGLMGPLQKFFTNLINALKNFSRQMHESIQAKIRSKNIKRQLRAFHAQLEEINKDPNHRKNEVEMIDIEKLSACICGATEELEKIHKRMMKNRYTHLSDLDKDIKDFNQIYEKTEKEYESIISVKVKIPVQRAIHIIENEITGKEPLVTSLDRCITSCEEMQRHVDEITQKRELYGVEVLPAYMTAVKRITSKFTNFIQRGVGAGMSKLLGTVVFLLA